MIAIFNTKAPFAVDLFLLVLLFVLGAMLIGVGLVRRGRVKAHTAVMTASFYIFIAGVITFEIGVQFGAQKPPLVVVPLVIHLCFAVPALLLWIRQMWTAKAARTDPARHKRRGRAVIALLCLGTATGFWLYWESFV